MLGVERRLGRYSATVGYERQIPTIEAAANNRLADCLQSPRDWALGYLPRIYGVNRSGRAKRRGSFCGRVAGTGRPSGHLLVELLAREVFVGGDGVALQVEPIEHLPRRPGAPARSKRIGIPSEAHSKYSRKPQK